MERDPADPKREAKDRKCMSQEYKVIVEEWIKGSGEKQLQVVYPEYTITTEGERIDEPYIALKPGHRYLLFLHKDVSNNFYSGVGEPWQFQLLNSKAQMQTAYEGKELEKLMAFTEDELLRQVRDASR
ncbi:hypothetical protein [Thermosediminibacter litoriperuensis]|uniref:Uncharacterized protein n=1 Tax=Thermosediminibacter litoriperuensis TaxID=291989 RepID=A0A5S5AUM5_9FIRM|nr:hypothetical protein [Thermosediminibacter litoriperuensis]TYP56167.1 hypothetical protein LZ11_01091 [Thermosediminibacter litoriperuensis]